MAAVRPRDLPAVSALALVALAALGGCARAPASPPARSEEQAASPRPNPGATAPATTASAPPAQAPPPVLVSMGAVPPLPPAPAQSSAVARTKSDAAYKACLRPPASRTARGDLNARSMGCAEATRMHLAGAARTGTQADRDASQSFPLDAKGGHCYRAFAQAGAGIEELRVVVRDSAGVEVAYGTSDDAGSVAVTDDGAVCFAKDDHASVVVSVGRGSGDYALQIWED